MNCRQRGKQSSWPNLTYYKVCLGTLMDRKTLENRSTRRGVNPGH